MFVMFFSRSSKTFSPRVLFSLVVLWSSGFAAHASAGERWTPEKATEWMSHYPWPVGCNYVPYDAINQLEMWQADTFDLKTIDRELGWAHDIGFNTMRVFLHNLAWSEDPEGFLKRIDQFLEVAHRHDIAILFVFFDSVWDPHPHAGPQRAPTPYVHNSGWVQSPGVDMLSDASTHAELERYVKAVLTRFHDDRRVVAWDLYNEPQNPNTDSYGQVETPRKSELALALMRKTFAWAREVNPIQPVTAGVWDGNWAAQGQLTAINTFMLENADVLSFHCYDDLTKVKQEVAALQGQGRPIFCTEYMARPLNSRFENVLAFFKEQHVAAYNWGFVEGKTQTNCPWDSWTKKYTEEPKEWFHDVLRPDGTPYKPAEVAFLKTLIHGQTPLLASAVIATVTR